MLIVSDTYQHVVGSIPTPRPTGVHLFQCPTGRLVDEATFPTTSAGLACVAGWVARRTGGDLDAVLVLAESTGSYGAGLAEHVPQVCERRDRKHVWAIRTRGTQQARADAEFALVRVVHRCGAYPEFVLLGGLDAPLLPTS